MKNKLINIIASCFIILLCLTGCNKETKEYKIKLSNLNNITKVTIDSLAQYNNISETNEKKTIKEIYNVFNEKETKEESLSDNPVKSDKLFIVNIEDDKNNISSFFTYQIDDKYYIEESYNGIY